MIQYWATGDLLVLLTKKNIFFLKKSQPLAELDYAKAFNQGQVKIRKTSALANSFFLICKQRIFKPIFL